MNLPRYYVGDRLDVAIQHFGAERCWLQDESLRKRFTLEGIALGDSIVLFNETLQLVYRIDDVASDEIALRKQTELSLRTPHPRVLVCCEAAVAKQPEVAYRLARAGVAHIVPLSREVSVRDTTPNTILDRLVRGVETSDFTDIPVFEPAVTLETALSRYGKKYNLTDMRGGDRVGCLITPSGGWSDDDRRMLDGYAACVFDNLESALGCLGELIQ